MKRVLNGLPVNLLLAIHLDVLFALTVRFLVFACDLVHDVETIFDLSYVLTASGNLF